MSLRWKITVSVTAVSTLVAVALSLVVHFAFAGRQADEARRLQVDRLDLVAAEYERSGEPSFGGRLNDPDLPGELGPAMASGRRATLLEDAGDGPLIWAATPVQDGVLSLRSSYDAQVEQLASLDRVLVAGAGAVVSVGAALGVLLGARLSRRLRGAATAARSIAGGDGRTRVLAAIGSGTRDEAADLGRAVDAMADALQGRLEAERRVTADIAHELRTPITGLTTAAELLPDSRPAELVRNRVRALRTLVEDVLEVARLDTDGERAERVEVELGEFTARRTPAHAPQAEVRVLARAVVTTDPRRLERVLANLLTNAVRHGAAPVVVEVEGPVVRVRDHGGGYPEEILREGPSRFRKGARQSAGGHGLGLTIAMGQAAVLGARLVLGNAPGGGAVATLDLS
jgi:signal transduction histidine kinase